MNKQVMFSGREYYEHIQFWKEMVSDHTESFSVRLNGVANESDHALSAYSFIIENEAKALLDKYTGLRELETFIMILSGLNILLGKYNETSSVIINTPLLLANPANEIWEAKVPVISSFNRHNSIKEILQKVNDIVLQSYRFQNFPFDMLHVNNQSVTNNRLSNVLVWHEALHHTPSEEEIKAHDLVITIKSRSETRIDVQVQYNANAFTEDQVAKLGEHLHVVIRQFENPETVYEDINVLTDGETDYLIQELNNTETNFKENGTVLDVFETQVRKNPAAIAVACDQQSITYQQLHMLSSMLARYLRCQYQVNKGSYVGVLMEKSSYSVICLLAIMKAGGIYVPIDISNPAERINYIIQDAGIATILTDTTQMFALDTFSGNMFAVDLQMDDIENIAGVELHNPLPGDLAYLIYTSGSTGRPKGVMIQHEGILNVALDHVTKLRMTEADRYLQFMSLSFDGSLLDIFTALLSGAKLVIPSRDIINDTSRFLRFADEQAITIFTITPSYLAALNNAPLATVRTIISAGEPADIEQAVYYAGFKEFYNGYGPTEVSVNATLYKMDPAQQFTSVPIGKPGANKKIYIVDKDLLPRPHGLPGEIVIGGIGLAKGYLNDEALTANKFIVSPFEPGKRIYRTGDLGRWLPDGNIEFLGRIDEQIKINGFRIDAGEIEHVLNTHEMIRNAKVLLKEKENVKSLVAFYRKEEKMEWVPSLGEYFIYDPFIYQSMAIDNMRVSAYQKGLERQVKGMVVLDPGTGSEMILARHCVEAGAAKVYAVEVDDEAYQAAAKNLIKYGLQEKIILLKGSFDQVELPEKIDCVVSALAGNIASADGCIPLIKKLKQRLNHPVQFIPGRYATCMAAVDLLNEKFYSGFSDISAHYIRQVFDKFKYPFDLRLCIKNFDENCIISDNAVCEDIVYADELNDEETKSVTLQITRKGRVTGFVFWINAFFKDEILINSRIATHHLPVYLPVFDEAVEVDESDVIEIRFERKLSDNQLNPDYIISGRIKRAGPDLEFSYTSFNNKPIFRSNGFYSQFFDDSDKIKTFGNASETGLKEYLSGYLPAYMIPSRITEIKDFPVTLNGKIDKKALLELEMEEAGSGNNSESPKTETEKLLADIWAAVLGKQQVKMSDDFFRSGGDSIKAIQIVSRLLKAGYKLEVKHIFERPVLTDLAMIITPVKRISDQSVIMGEIPLTPIQQEVFVPDTIDRHHFNQAVMLFSKQGFPEEATKAVFKKIQEHHDALRIVWVQDKSGWKQINKGIDHPLSLVVYNLDNVENSEGFITEKANELQAGIDLENGPLMKVCLFQSTDGDRLLIVIHHLVVDGVSWRILMEDIKKLYDQYAGGQKLELPLKTDSFKTWAEKLLEYANNSSLLQQVRYWAAIDKELQPVFKNDPSIAGNYLRDAGSIHVSLPENETRQLLTNVGSVLNLQINDILLTALALSIHQCFGLPSIPVAMEGHGREEILKDLSISRTVGWFTSMYPVVLHVLADKNIAGQAEHIRKMLAEIPGKGIGYGILKHLASAENRKEISCKFLPQISFNYLGQFDSDLHASSYTIAKESYGNTLSENKCRLFELDFNALVLHDQLRLTITYNTGRFERQQIVKLAEAYKNALIDILSCSNELNEKQRLPAEFSYQGLTADDIDSIFN